MRSLHALALILGVAELGAACASDGIAPSHTPPTADFMSSCAGLACSFTDRCVSPASGTAPSDISVSVNTAGLGSLGGVYFGRITISAVGASNSPQTVLVTLYRR